MHCVEVLNAEIGYCADYIDRNKASNANIATRKNFERYIKTLEECLLTMHEYAKSVMLMDDKPVNKDPLREAAKCLFNLNLLNDINNNLSGKDITTMITENLDSFTDNELLDVVEFANTCPGIINRNIVHEALITARDKLRLQNTIAAYMRLDVMNEAIDNISENGIYGAYNDIDSLMGCLMCVDEIVRTISGAQHNEYITESSCVDTIRSILDDVRSRFATARPGTVTGIVVRTFNNFDQTPRPSTLDIPLMDALRIAVVNIIHNSSTTWLGKPLYYILQAYVEFFTRDGIIYKVANDAIETLKYCSDECAKNIESRQKQNPDDPFIRTCEALKKQLDIAIARINYATATRTNPTVKEGDE